jgi:enoyl-[acyl-carrier protein] reductase/trans-2-enoyl-CoA reductase (NAD+)
MKLALPEFQFRFMAAAGNVIFPGNFHPVGSQRSAEQLVERALANGKQASAGSGGIWLVVGGSGGFGSAARVALGCDLGAHTINLSYDAPPQPESSNKIRKIGSPAWHRNRAIERKLSALGLQAYTHNADAFDPATRKAVISGVRERFAGQKIAGVIWALASPRGLDPRSGKTISSALKPLGQPATVKTFAAPEGNEGPRIVEIQIPAGTPEEAVATQYVMGGGIVDLWVRELLDADLVGPGFRLLTVSYRGNPLNANIYRNGLIGLAKADLEFHTQALDALLRARVGGQAIAVEGPAVVTESSGGIPGVPLYMTLISEVMGAAFEDPLDNMRRMVVEHLLPGKSPTLDGEGLLRMDDRELAPAIQEKMAALYASLQPGAEVSRDAYDRFIRAYSQTRGFNIEGIDYNAEFDVEDICR